MPPKRPRAARLPNALTPILGRANELEELGRLLSSTRLLSITGAGGSGKTRLALELAHRVRARFDDAVWVELAPISDPDLIAEQILGAFGERDVAPEDMLQALLDTIRDRRLLLILDNCEHVVAGAAFVTEEILHACPEAAIVTTTREALGLPGEQTWRVPPLSLPDAVRLFDERARAALPSFRSDDALVQQICRRLDGIPLAIELAAARVKVLSLSDIASRLDDAFRLLTSGSRTLPRHRTIRETIDWSYRLLSPDEQLLLQRVSVFASSFSLEAAEAVGGNEVLTHLSALVDKSLVIAEESRYRLLDTVQQFAAEKLEESGQRDELRRRHARYFVSLVERLEPRLAAGGVDTAALEAIDSELPNIRAVFDSDVLAAESDPVRADIELRLVYALHWYCFARGLFHDARRRVTAALSHCAGADRMVIARAKIAAAAAAVWQGDWDAVRPGIDEAIVMLDRVSDAQPLAMALTLRGVAEAFAEHDHEAASHSFGEARTLGSGATLAMTIYWSGLAAQLRGEWSAARTAFEEALAIGQAIGNKPAIAHPLTALGHVALHEGSLAEAIRCFGEALELHTETSDRWGLTQVIEGIGVALLDARETETGTRLLAAASAAWLHLGARPGRGTSFEQEKNSRIREALGDERLRIVLASGAAMSYESMVALAREQLSRLGVRAHPPLRVHALGALEIERNGEPVEESARSRELLLFLLCHPAGRTKEQIGAALWPDSDPAKLRNNFHVTLHRLRKSLGASEWIVVDGDTYALDRSRGVECDVEAFEREATAGLRARDPERLANAVALYGGDFFESGGAGEWYLPIRLRLRDLYARALEALARVRTASGDHAAAAEAWQKLVDLDDLDEDAAKNLMDAYTKAGDAASAKRAYRRLSDALKRELGVAPSF